MMDVGRSRGGTRAVGVVGWFLGVLLIAAGPEVSGREKDQLRPARPRVIRTIGDDRFKHPGQVRSVALAEGGEWCAAAGEGPTITVWGVQSGKAVFRLHTEHESVSSLALGPAGRWLVSGGTDSSVQVWDLVTRKSRAMLRGHAEGPVCVDVARVARRLTVFSGAFDGSLIAWELGGESRYILRRGGYAIEDLAYSGGEIVVNSGDRGIEVLSAADGRIVRTLAAEHPRAVAVSDNGDVTAVLHKAGIRVWRKDGVLDLAGSYWALTVSANGARLAAGQTDGVIRVWDLVTGQEICLLRGHAGRIQALDMNRDGTLLVSGATDCTVRVWDANAGKELVPIRGHLGPVLAVSATADGSTIVSGGVDGTVRLWREGRALMYRGHGKSVYCVLIDAREGLIASGGADGSIRLWSLQGEPVRSWTAHALGVLCLAKSDDGTRLASGGADRSVAIWTSSGRLERRLTGHEDFVWAVAFDANARTLYSGDDRGVVKSWEAATGRELRSVELGEGAVLTLSVHPQKQLLAAGSKRGVVCLWAANGSVRRFRAASSAIVGVQFDRDGRSLFVASSSGEISVWDSASRECTGRLQLDIGLRCLEYSGGKIYVGCADSTVRVLAVD